jgi:hypothetical protein
MLMFKEQKAQFEINLSGTKVSFETPANFSRDFGCPESFKSTINVFDADNYPSEPSIRHLFSVLILYWDYISGVFIKDIDGTMSMNILVEKIADTNVAINGVEQLQENIPINFNATYNDNERKIIKTGIVDPHDFSTVFFPSGKWLNYHYRIGTGEKVAYSMPFFGTHYLTISFDRMSGYADKYLIKVNKDILEIMHSFKITPP